MKSSPADWERDCPTPELSELSSVCAGQQGRRRGGGGGCDQGASTSWHKIQYRQRRGSKKRRGLVRSGQLGSAQCCGTSSSHDDTSQPVQRAARHVWLLDPPLWVQAAVVLLCCERGMMRGRLAARIRRATGRKSGGVAFKIKAGFVSENTKQQRLYRNRRVRVMGFMLIYSQASNSVHNTHRVL